MPKFTFYAVLQILRLVVTFVDKCIRLVYSALDLVDDGCKNDSVSVPEWLSTVQEVLTYLKFSSSELGDFLSKNSTIDE